jgi:hypothetical protein
LLNKEQALNLGDYIMAELNTTTPTPALTGTKPVFASKTVIVSVLTALLGVLGLLGLTPAGLDATPLADALFTILGVASGIFRYFATKKLGG